MNEMDEMNEWNGLNECMLKLMNEMKRNEMDKWMNVWMKSMQWNDCNVWIKWMNETNECMNGMNEWNSRNND